MTARILTAFDGRRYRLDEIITGEKARASQIYPGFVQLNISPEGASVPNQAGVTLPAWLAHAWMQNRVRVKV